MHRTMNLLCALLVILMLAACSTGGPVTPVGGPSATVPATAEIVASPTAGTPAAAEGEAEAAYPAPGYPGPGEPYPGPALADTLEATRQALPTLAPLAEPSAGKGHLTGRIMRESDIRPREPLAGWTLYLAEVHRNVSGEISPLASVMEDTAPQTVTDRDGRYAFTDLEPGLYALVIKHPLTLVLARDLLTDQDVVVEIVADQITEEPLTVVTLSD